MPEKKRFVLRTVTSMDHVAILDGTVVFSRLTTRRAASTLTTRVVKLEAGTHRLIVRMARENQAGNITVALHTLDGSPAGLTFAPSQGAAPQATHLRSAEYSARNGRARQLRGRSRLSRPKSLNVRIRRRRWRRRQRLRPQ